MHLVDDANLLVLDRRFRELPDADMTPESSPVSIQVNEPMMPVAWTRLRDFGAESAQRIFSTTMGAAGDCSCEDLRRLLFNAYFGAQGLEAQIPDNGLEAGLLGTWQPYPIGFNAFPKGLQPRDYAEGTPQDTSTPR